MSTANQTSEKVHTCVSTAFEQWSPTDAELEALARQHGTGGWQSLSDMVRFARAVLAIKPQPEGTRVTGRELNRFSVHGANIYDHLDDADVLIRVDGDWESEADRDQYVNALAARLQAPAPGPMTDADVGALTYEGNTVSYIKERAEVYANEIMSCWQALREAGFVSLDGHLSHAIRTALVAQAPAPEERMHPGLVRALADRHFRGATDAADLFAMAANVIREDGQVLAGQRTLIDMLKARATQAPAVKDALEALRDVHALISEAAATGFNCHDGDWAERLFRSQGARFDVLHAHGMSPSHVPVQGSQS